MKKQRSCLFLLIVLIMTVFSSCYIPVNWKMNHRPVLLLNGQIFTDKEVKLVALDNKSRFENYYSDLYGDGFFDIPVTEGMTYESYIKEFFIFRELKAVLILDNIASDRKISLSMEDKEYLHSEAEKFYKSMTDDEKEYTGATLDDVYDLFYKYYLAREAEETLLEDKKAEISEEESRVADIQIIRTSSYTKAEYILQRLNNGESFLMLASELSEGKHINYSVAKGELTEALDEVVFSMADNEISDIIEERGKYYIIRMDNSYNLLLSVKNSENLLASKRFKLWEEDYIQAEKAYTVRREKSFFDELSLSVKGDYPYHNLFSFLEKN